MKKCFIALFCLASLSLTACGATIVVVKNSTSDTTMTNVIVKTKSGSTANSVKLGTLSENASSAETDWEFEDLVVTVDFDEGSPTTTSVTLGDGETNTITMSGSSGSYTFSVAAD